MKKLLAAVTIGVVIAGTAATSVSAEEYTVQEGDSLWSIANEYSTTVDDIVDINDLDSKIIHPDQKLSIDNETTYKVKKGDTLSGIAKKFDVKVKDIKEWNDLKTDLIVVGQELELEGVTTEQDQDVNEPSNNVEEVNDNADDLNNKEAVPQEENQEAANQAQEEDQGTADQQAQEDTTAKQEETENQADNGDAPEGKTINVSATAYTASCPGCSGVTSTGVDLGDNPDAKVIAVDPDVIPLGSEVYVEGYGHATAADTGGAINGNKIDVHVPDEGEANSWGVKNVNVTILD